MAQPAPYNRAFNFSNFQAGNPTSPLPGGSVDEELGRIKATLDQIRANLKLIQRDDTALANRSVGFDQLKTEIEIGINPPTAWETDTNYVVRDTVFANSSFYICLESHVSGTFATDLAADKWELIASFEAATSANSVTFDDSTAALGASLVQTAIEAVKTLVDTNTDNIDNMAATDVAFDATGLGNTDADDVAEALGDLDTALTARGALTGEVKLWPGAALPSGYLYCDGSAISRTTYAALFTAISTTWGVGDGTTTFNVPDLRGRVPAGRDNMGGTSANRLTNQSGGLNGDTLGAVGGSETHTLTSTQLAAHTHGAGTLAAASNGAHTHSVTAGNDSNTFGTTPYLSGSVASVPYNTASSGAHTHTITGDTGSVGSGDAHNNVQPTAILNFIIKT